MDAVSYRPLNTEDAAILQEATVFNLNWESERFSLADVLGDPKLAHYTTLVPDRGDFGIVAESAGSWVGVVWMLFLPEDDPGYGFVAPGVPELSICVAPGRRGQGIGSDLMERALTASRDRGLSSVSLSVETGNRARDLYVKSGFTPVEGKTADVLAVTL